MTDTELVKALWRIAVLEHDPMKCLGCGYEHSCSLHGCQIIKTAAKRLNELTGTPRDQSRGVEMFRKLGYQPTEYDGNGAEFKKGPYIILIHAKGILKTCETSYGTGSEILTPEEVRAVAQILQEIRKPGFPLLEDEPGFVPGILTEAAP